MENTEKQSSDIYFVAALLSMGLQISNVDRSDPRHLNFTIKNQGMPITQNIPGEPALIMPTFDLDKIETEWINGVLMVNAQQYKESIQRMKSLIHSK